MASSSISRFCAFALIWFNATSANAATDELAVGIDLYNKAQYAQAIAHLAAAQGQQKQMPRALYYRALAELKLGKTVEGADTLRALVRVAPESSEASLAQKYLNGMSKAAPQANLPKHVKIPYVMGRDGWMHVDAVVGGETVDMVWDTGATNCSLPHFAVQEFPHESKSIEVETPHGKQSAVAGFVEMKVGGLKRRALTTMMDGTAVIGHSFFRDYKVEVNREHRIIYLDLSEPSEAAAKPAKRSKFELPFEREGGILLVNITIDGQATKAYFDTGCAAKGIAMAHPKNQFVDITLGPITRKAVPVTEANGMSRPLVGPAIFGDRGYKIDPARQVIDFDYAQN